ncbi:unnamed protein product [Effrenium voratum]|uniref:Uncharacterized protein n=1 Tax=Effrenium voratum TaxID=2562239 RepID=A0AA36JH81_9DINO|nr:unnamed protein product [Effrenium voratum]CAJ1406173.1 unnamed protein product [Effrenium voratum]CAJ1412280.1 unnamed protein product [Effrenium voratum]|mmetsp:Transcript_33291/g.79832  ORF Transcript_33291/g.79832 Transcript_33291/m.79832 type:complete len:269 (-) Transcript_33291:36-842(-)|eukprot:CAMPEP_0181432378 /NCGR_PEP_ID=MMETSP1110-20121109/18737_1 /TAXON_ID=174948 /ORGANISM="Symbiodinium sp., Strain CCMP421" /LENGTH=268 /DNA_ID=CAMNT_0023555781 /DNA_START=39 /DNA_END=845 /DNA_ORIENTATION=-
MGVPLSTACCCTVGDPDGCVEQLRTGRVVEQQAAAAGIASIARRKVQRRSQWMADAVPLLVQAVTRGESMDLREHAARALANLPMCDAANAQTIVDAGGVQALVYLLGVESYGCRAQAARALGNMCVVSKAAARKILHGGAVQPLLTALLTDEAPIAGINLSVEAAVALANFSSVDTHCRNAVLQSAVVIPGLQHLAASEDSQTKAAARRALLALAQGSMRARQALEACESQQLDTARSAPSPRSPQRLEPEVTEKVFGRKSPMVTVR